VDRWVADFVDGLRRTTRTVVVEKEKEGRGREGRGWDRERRFISRNTIQQSKII